MIEPCAAIWSPAGGFHSAQQGSSPASPASRTPGAPFANRDAVRLPLARRRPVCSLSAPPATADGSGARPCPTLSNAVGHVWGSAPRPTPVEFWHVPVRQLLTLLIRICCACLLQTPGLPKHAASAEASSPLWSFLTTLHSRTLSAAAPVVCSRAQSLSAIRML